VFAPTNAAFRHVAAGTSTRGEVKKQGDADQDPDHMSWPGKLAADDLTTARN